MACQQISTERDEQIYRQFYRYFLSKFIDILYKRVFIKVLGHPINNAVFLYVRNPLTQFADFFDCTQLSMNS